MAMHMGDTGELDGDTPRPVYAGSVSNGAFDKLEEGQGAVSASEKRHDTKSSGAHYASDNKPRHQAASHRAQSDEEQPPIDKRTLIVVVVGALVAIVVIVILFINVLNASPATPAKEKEAEQVAVSTDQSIEIRGTNFTLVQNDGKYQLLEKRDGGKEVVLGDLPGTPAGFVLYDGSVLIPENLEGGKWDVMSYTIGSGWNQIMGKDGKPVGGEGTVEDTKLEGTTLVLTVGGNRTEVPLVW